MAYGKGYSGFATKNAGIERAMERKERGIRAYTDAKTLSIAVSSAFNSASDLVNGLVANKAVKVAEYWEVHTKWYDEFFNRFMDAQDAAKTNANKPFQEAKNALARKEDLHEENVELAALDEVPNNNLL